MICDQNRRTASGLFRTEPVRKFRFSPSKRITSMAFQVEGEFPFLSVHDNQKYGMCCWNSAESRPERSLRQWHNHAGRNIDIITCLNRNVVSSTLALRTALFKALRVTPVSYQSIRHRAASRIYHISFSAHLHVSYASLGCLNRSFSLAQSALQAKIHRTVA